MRVPDLWGTDLKMLQLVVKLQVSNNGTFPLDQLMDEVGLLDHGDSYSDFAPWSVTESLRRLQDGGFIVYLKGPFSVDDEDEDEAEDFLGFADRWLDTDDNQLVREILMDERQHERRLAQELRGKRRRIEEAFFKGKSFDDVYWHNGRFYIDSAPQVYELRSTPEGLRRVGAWPNPERFSEDLIAILGNVAQAIEGQHPQDAKKLREVGKVLRSNAIELSAALLAKLIEHTAGL